MRQGKHENARTGVESSARTAKTGIVSARTEGTHSRTEHSLLQRQIGNQATATLALTKQPATAPPLAAAPTAQLRATGSPGVVQRLPRRKDVEAAVGEAKAHTRNKLSGTWLGKKLKVKETLKENSTQYRPVLNALEGFEQFVDTTELAPDPSGMDAQLNTALTHYQRIEDAANNYVNVKQNNKKAKFMMRNLLPQLKAERTGVVMKIARYKTNPPPSNGLPKWWIITSSVAYRELNLDDEQMTGQVDRGGINEVSFFKNVYGEEGVFKEGKDEILDPEELPDNLDNKERDALETEHWVASSFVDMDTKDARLAERNVAMSRLDELLGGGVIAKTEFALHKAGDGSFHKGTFMAKAKGEKAGKLGNQEGRIVKNQEEKTASSSPDTINVQDGNLQRLMSRLQLIDALAMQVDRHAGNFFIEYDSRGNVIGLTGIDNDMAFGRVKDVEKRNKEFPGLSKFVDKELAQRILALKDEHLTAIMVDLLSPDEIQAMLERLHGLQAHLQKESTRLLEPDEWDEATAKGMLEERKERISNKGTENSYYANFAHVV